MIKIFDSAMHPTINQTWINPKYNDYSNMECLLQDMKKNNIYKALALGLKNVGDYHLEKYIEFLKPYPQFIPIAYCDDINTLTKTAKLGYKGIKIHPRIGNLINNEEKILHIITEANALNLKVIYCGFLGVSDYFLDTINNNSLVFLHTGGKDLSKTYAKLKSFSNILLDFSYTMCNYPELTTEIKTIFKEIPNRICIGSDQPEIRLDFFRQTFEKLTQNLSLENKEKIAYKNLEYYINN